MLRSFNGTIDAEVAHSKVNSRMMHQVQKQESHNNTMTIGSDQDKNSEDGERSVTSAGTRPSVDKSSATNNTLTNNKF